MVRQHHQLNGHEFEQTLGNSEDREAWRAAVHGVRVRHDLAIIQQHHRENSPVGIVFPL